MHLAPEAVVGLHKPTWSSVITSPKPRWKPTTCAPDSRRETRPPMDDKSHRFYYAASFHPPAMPEPDPDAPAHSRRRPDWVLLDKLAYIADRPNGTTAQCIGPAGQHVQVSFWLADPPGLSHLCVHCPGLDESAFEREPSVVCSEKDVAIIEVHFVSDSGPGPSCRSHLLPEGIQYFVYKADHERPSLHSLPFPSTTLFFRSNELGLLPRPDGQGFHVALLRPRLPPLGPPSPTFQPEYDLHTFSSETRRWCTKPAWMWPPRRPAGKPALPCRRVDKVIVLDDETLGFVDLWHGILCCRVVDFSPFVFMRHIRLPPPMRVNRAMFNGASRIRDVACVNGVIKFVEIASRKRVVVCEQSDLVSHNTSILRDSDLDELANMPEDDTDDDEVVFAYDGWAVSTWNRQTGSDHWVRGCQVDVNEVTVDPRHLDVLPQLSLSSGHSGKLTMNKTLEVSVPAFGLQDRDVVYLMCRLDPFEGKTAWIFAIDTREKTLEDLASFSTARIVYFYRTYSPCALSKHMDMAPCNRKVGCRAKRKRDDAEAAPIDTTVTHNSFLLE